MVQYELANGKKITGPTLEAVRKVGQWCNANSVTDDDDLTAKITAYLAGAGSVAQLANRCGTVFGLLFTITDR